jgi:menaquinone-dependent protoporphyrinogen IX oxidase
MAASRSPKVFLSAASGQFRECREAIARELRAVGSEVKVQGGFTVGPGTEGSTLN